MNIILFSGGYLLIPVLLHNKNSKPSVPLGHSTTRRETYSTREVLLERLNYSKDTWKIYSDHKVYLFPLDCSKGMPFMCASYAFGKDVKTVVITL